MSITRGIRAALESLNASHMQELDEWKQLDQLRSASIAMATKSFVADLDPINTENYKVEALYLIL